MTKPSLMMGSGAHELRLPWYTVTLTSGTTGEPEETVTVQADGWEQAADLAEQQHPGQYTVNVRQEEPSDGRVLQLPVNRMLLHYRRNRDRIDLAHFLTADTDRWTWQEIAHTRRVLRCT